LAEPFRFTTGRWYNKPRDDGGYAKAPAYREGFTYEDFAYGTDTPEDFTPDGGPLQHSLICSKSAQFLAVDVDYPENLPGSATGQLLSWAGAISTRGSHFHCGVDMRGVKPEDWPAQGRTAWGDVKAAGFIPVPGSVHYSGARYEAALSWESRIARATPELLEALKADRAAHALSRLNEARTRLGMATGTRLDDGTYLYASGYARGSWQWLPPASLAHDDELKDLAWDMHVEYGREEAEVRATWERLARADGTPWRDRDFTRHWHRVPARRAERLEQDDATRLMEDFGLRLLPPRLEQEYAHQRSDWEQRAKQAADQGGAAPTPVPDDGPFEDPRDPGADLFDWNLRVGAYRQPFDAGMPNDSDNARAVLARIAGVSAYLTDRGVWLKRVGARWDDQELGANLRPVLAAVEEVMPKGCADPVKAMDKDPDADAAEIAALKAQAKNLERFKSTSTRSAIATACADTAVRYSGRGLATRADLLDTDPEVLWAGGVPWDLRASAEGPVRAALDRRTPHVMSAAVVPDLSGPHWRWDAFCEALWPGAPEDGREWALNVLAACFTGYADAVMPILMGDPGRGKTHLVKRLIDVLGGNTAWSYGGVMNADLLRSDAKVHGTFTLDLKGKRLAFIDEAPGHGMAAQRRLKSLTGGGALQGNRMRENPVSFSPTHTLVMTANHEDPPPLDEPALQRRARLVFFEGDTDAVDAASALIDGSAAARAGWHEEMPWVLADMMRRAARWLEDRHLADADQAPLRWQGKTAEETAVQDPVLAWLEAGEVVPDPAGTRSSVLRANFVAWCKGQGLPPGTETKWGRQLTKLGFPVSRRDAGGRYRPLRVVLPGAAEFMHGQPGTATVQGTQHPENPQVSGSSLYGVYGLYSSTTTTHKESPNNPPTGKTHTHINKGVTRKPDNPTPGPSDVRSDLRIHGLVHGSQTVQDGARPDTGVFVSGEESPRGANPPRVGVHQPPVTGGVPEAEPAAPEKSLPPETSKNDENGKEAETPPKKKTPRTRLTDEEKAQREAARKAKLAQDRLDARAAKIAELGGPLVQLPAVVLRDQRILPCSPYQAACFLADAVDELSVDVEHTGYPRQHKDYALRLVQLGTEHFAVVLDPSDPEQAAVIRDVLAEARVLHAHSALADLIPLEAAGLCDATAWDRLVDTVNLAKLTDPALCDSDEAGLKALARNLLGPDYALSWKADELRKEIFAAGGWIGDCEVTTPVERSGWAQVPLCEAFVRYSAADVLDCSAVARKLQEGP
jgi:phage/plasmid-associated DNA primase